MMAMTISWNRKPLKCATELGGKDESSSAAHRNGPTPYIHPSSSHGSEARKKPCGTEEPHATDQSG